jgi:hypothetical protein
MLSNSALFAIEISLIDRKKFSLVLHSSGARYVEWDMTDHKLRKSMDRYVRIPIPEPVPAGNFTHMYSTEKKSLPCMLLIHVPYPLVFSDLYVSNNPVKSSKIASLGSLALSLSLLKKSQIIVSRRNAPSQHSYFSQISPRVEKLSVSITTSCTTH